MVRDALQALGEVPPEAVSAYVATRYGERIEPKYIPLFRATLLDQKLLADRRSVPFTQPPDPVPDTAVPDALEPAAVAWLVSPPRVASAVAAVLLPEAGSQRMAAVETFATQLITAHGLSDWSFAYNRRKRAMGLCVYQRRTIELSAPFVERNGPPELLDTLLHEIAHALVGPGHGHDAVWKQKCIEVGAKPQRCGEADMPEGNWRARCGSCGKEFQRYRKPKRMRGWFCQKCGQERGGLVWREE